MPRRSETLFRGTVCINACTYGSVGAPGRQLPGATRQLADSVFQSLIKASDDSETLIPLFDKSLDDRLPESKWEIYRGRPEIIIFEGWCIGARPQPVNELKAPINSRERDEDPDGKWRYMVNEFLRAYQSLFSVIDLLLLIKVPNWPDVLKLRWEQEVQRKNHLAFKEFNEFLSLYQRLCQYMLREMPQRADLEIEIDRNRELIEVAIN